MAFMGGFGTKFVIDATSASDFFGTPGGKLAPTVGTIDASPRSGWSRWLLNLVLVVSGGLKTLADNVRRFAVGSEELPCFLLSHGV